MLAVKVRSFLVLLEGPFANRSRWYRLIPVLAVERVLWSDPPHLLTFVGKRKTIKGPQKRKLEDSSSGPNVEKKALTIRDGDVSSAPHEEHESYETGNAASVSREEWKQKQVPEQCTGTGDCQQVTQSSGHTRQEKAEALDRPTDTTGDQLYPMGQQSTEKVPHPSPQPLTPYRVRPQAKAQRCVAFGVATPALNESALSVRDSRVIRSSVHTSEQRVPFSLAVKPAGAQLWAVEVPLVHAMLPDETTIQDFVTSGSLIEVTESYIGNEALTSRATGVHHCIQTLDRCSSKTLNDFLVLVTGARNTNVLWGYRIWQTESESKLSVTKQFSIDFSLFGFGSTSLMPTNEVLVCGFLHSYSNTILKQNRDSSINPNKNEKENAGDRRELMQTDEHEHEYYLSLLLLTERSANRSKSSAQGLWAIAIPDTIDGQYHQAEQFVASEQPKCSSPDDLQPVHQPFALNPMKPLIAWGGTLHHCDRLIADCDLSVHKFRHKQGHSHQNEDYLMNN